MKIPPCLAALALFVSVAACAGAGEKRILYVYTWEDYFPRAEVEAFEQEHGCAVDFDYYDSNETMLTTLLEAGGYDIVTPPPSMAQILFEEGKLHPLNHSLLPDIGNIDTSSPSLADDPAMRYSVPYASTITGIGYNRSMVTAEEAGSWALFADARFAGRMTMLNDMRETIGAALKHLGFSVNTTNPDEIDEAGRVVREWKKNLAMFAVDRAKEGLRNGSYAAIQAYSGDVAALMASSPDIAFSVPEEGSAFNADVFAIPSDSESPELAHAFINHFLDASAARNTMLEIRYYLPNKAAHALLEGTALWDTGFILSPGVRAKSELIRNLHESDALYENVWEGILLD